MKIDLKGLTTILEMTPSSQNIMLVGGHGIGKSRILTDYYQKKGLDVVTLFLGQMSDPGDIIGLPRANGDSTDFLLPYWFPKNNKPIVLFLDELNRARPEVLQTIMDLALNRKLAGHNLPEGSRIISAVNDGNEYQLTELDPALVSRFNIYEFGPTVGDWIDWAQSSGIDKRVIDYISSYPDMLDAKELRKEDQGLKRTPDRRSWERMSQVLTREDSKIEEIKTLAMGIIGDVAAVKFCTFLTSSVITADKLLLGSYDSWKNQIVKMQIPAISVLNEALFRYIENGVKLEEEKKVSENLTQYFALLNGINREASAHFVNQYTSGSYPQTMVYITTKCKSLYEDLISFVKEL